MPGPSRRFLVTAGSTREMIDSVRDWGNIFTGRTGLDIAVALSKTGHVDLLTSNPAHLNQTSTLHPHAFRAHADLRSLLEMKMVQGIYDAVFMTAAVADYRPVGVYEVSRQQSEGEVEIWTVRNVQAAKVSSKYNRVAILADPTEKLVDLFRTQWHHKGLLVKFKLEVGVSSEQLIEIGQASRKASRAEYLVANTLDMARGSHNQPAGAYLLSDAGAEWVDRANLPARLAALANPLGGI